MELLKENHPLLHLPVTGYCGHFLAGGKENLLVEI
jgi:hypothetical protein